MSSIVRFFTSRNETSRMTWVRADVERASMSLRWSETDVFYKPARYVPVSQSSLPKRPGVPTAAAIFVLFKYATCSSSLKCFANNLATSPPFSPRNRLSLSTLVTSATRRAAPATNRRVGAPFDLGLWPMRVRRVGSTVAEDQRLQSRQEEERLNLTLENEVHQLVQVPRSRPCGCVRYGSLCLCVNTENAPTHEK